jgi:hypothetical protein
VVDTAGTQQLDLELQIRDFGPIASAVIRPRPLTVFIGPSGSGKSFAATALYAFARTGQELATAMDGSSRFAGYSESVDKLIGDIARKYVDLFESAPDGEPPDLRSVNMWTDFARHATGSHFAFAVSAAGAQLLGAAELTELTRFASAGAWAVTVGASGLVKLQSAQTGAVIYRDLFAPAAAEHQFDFDWVVDWARRRQYVAGDSIPVEHKGKVAAGAFIKEFSRFFQQHFGPAPLLMPTGRTGMSATGPFADRLLAIGAGHHVEMAGHSADFLDQLRIAGRAEPGDFNELIDEIEEDLHHGRIEQRSGSTMFPILDLIVGEHRIPMERASSSVSELAPVTFILRRLARKGMIVVLEEPEAHLHPAKQVRLAHALARLVHAGLRIVVTTHSEFLLDALGWIVRATEIGAPTRPTLPEAERLAKGDVGVYRFHEPDPGAGFTATEIEFDPEEGYDRANWVDEAGKLFNRHADVSRRQRQGAEKGKR